MRCGAIALRVLEVTPELQSAKDLFRKQVEKVGRFEGEIRKIPVYGKRRIFDIPENLDFEDNYEQSLECFLGIRSIGEKLRRRKFQYYLEFSALKNIQPSALLVLAAELDCRLGLSTRINRRNRIPADANRWEPHITALFEDFGIFELLKVKPNVRMTFGENLKAVKFRIGKMQDGKAAQKLIKDIIETTGKQPNEEARLWEGIGEAVTNVLDHAYPHPHVSYPAKRIPAWWAGAIYDENSRNTHFMVYDRGIGLPKSLPEKAGFSALWKSLGMTNTTDAGLIWAAIQQPSSGTQLEYRGEGLRQMAEVVDNHPGSSLQILSGNGSVTYIGMQKPILKTLPVEFCGTLVEWRIQHD